ncbi:MAG: hypothetical protein ACRDFT_08790 [bacterium]
MRTFILTAVIVLTALTGTASAQPPAGSSTANAVIVCNQVALRIRVPAGGMSVQQRIDTVYQRIVAAWARERISADRVTLRQSAGTWSIYAGSTLIITVQQADARANGTTAAALAQAWHARLRELLPECRP